jgi:hypothetical protein
MYIVKFYFFALFRIFYKYKDILDNFFYILFKFYK